MFLTYRFVVFLTFFLFIFDLIHEHIDLVILIMLPNHVLSFIYLIWEINLLLFIILSYSIIIINLYIVYLYVSK
jgi:hypothetical protein